MVCLTGIETSVWKGGSIFCETSFVLKEQKSSQATSKKKKKRSCRATEWNCNVRAASLSFSVYNSLSIKSDLFSLLQTSLLLKILDFCSSLSSIWIYLIYPKPNSNSNTGHTPNIDSWVVMTPIYTFVLPFPEAFKTQI